MCSCFDRTHRHTESCAFHFMFTLISSRKNNINMGFALRNYIFIIISITSIVCGVINTQDVDVKESSSNQDSESHTFHPSVPVLSQMDYEILGTNGFSITDVTQNSNFSNTIRKEMELHKSEQSSSTTKDNRKQSKKVAKKILNKKINEETATQSREQFTISEEFRLNFTSQNTSDAQNTTSPLLELITYFTTFSYEQTTNHTVSNEESESNTSIDQWSDPVDDNITLSNHTNASNSSSHRTENATSPEEITTYKTLYTDGPNNWTIKEEPEEITENLTLSTTTDFQFNKEEESTSTIAAATTKNVIQSTEEASTLTDANQTPYTRTTELRKTTTEVHVDDNTTPPLDVTSTTSTERPQMLVNMSGQIRIIRGMIWMYQLNDKMSAEYQYYSRKVQRMLQEMFWQTWLAKHIKKISVQKFRRGSVMVDFNLLVKTDKHVEAQQMEILFNSYLLPDGGFGGFQMDRHFTKFQIFEPELKEAITHDPDERSIPQWATALIVIAGASLVFVIIFGIVTVYGNCTSIFGRNHRRLQEETGNSFKQNDEKCKDWESKVTSAYENLAADGIYDLDDVGDKNVKASDKCKRKLENTQA
ncbi:uncharacterized protein LOC111624943 isoform X1 [Centruroides sculpturatus]|uniref:uncharacterized protein LOC111624943 isoform X1 n=1 Tax=Centruroides sculpturatus TaxID=218467 RepID=UPI000C6E416C|nr:uncharacterized protein LOC111624943 isoform X1 [Centruroides sculpturatus]